jgi:hypothetical protein
MVTVNNKPVLMVANNNEQAQAFTIQKEKN